MGRNHSKNDLRLFLRADYRNKPKHVKDQFNAQYKYTIH